MYKYQFFISSTYDDLKEERNSAINIVMKHHQIPAGMELFGAMGEEQWKYIKKEINESDYYLLILAGKYGSLNSDGISYTEAEYDYACKLNKRIIAFLYKDIEQLPVKKVEMDIDKNAKLKKFIEKVKKDKLVEFWGDYQELTEKMNFAISNVMREYPSETRWIHWDESLEEYEVSEWNRKDNEDEEDQYNWKFQETKDIDLQLEISSDVNNPSQAVMNGREAYVILQRRDGPICSYMKHACEEYVKLIEHRNKTLFTSDRFLGVKEVLCMRKMWFDTKNPNVTIFVDYLYNYDIQPTYLVDEIKKYLYDGKVLGDGQCYDVMIRVLSVNMYSDHFFENNKEFYDEEDMSRYIEVKLNYTKFEYSDFVQKRQVIAELEVTNKSKNTLEYNLSCLFRMLDSDMFIRCDAKNINGTKEFKLKSLETKIEHFQFDTNDDIEKNPEDIEVYVRNNKPKYE